jgi:aspartyl-tRNA(Asn)/glutamyl-tRNA(Gln) amidotransferase subunit A
MHHNTITQIVKDLADKTYSSEEIVQNFLARIQKEDKQLNSFITVTAEQALAEAKIADTRRAQGDTAPLLGVPIAHKDIFCTKGVRTTCASKMLDNFIAPYDATVVSNLQQAGCISLGKTNMDEFAMGSSNETSFYGPSKNPWDTSRVPGGSSGGSAAAVAAGLVPAATATDTGGSVRQPAAFCGITGLKPTYGRVSRYGQIAFASSLDQAGIMARTAEDCALLLKAMAGYDEKDATCLNVPVPDYPSLLHTSLKGLRIGLPKEYFEHELDDGVHKAIDAALSEFQKLGATLHEISLPTTALSISVYYVVAPAEASSNLARYDGVRYGYRCENPTDLLDLYERSRSEGFGEEVKRRIMIGTYMLSAGYYDAYYLKSQKIRRLVTEDFKRAFESVDIIFAPSTPNVAFKLGEKSDPVSMYLSDIYTIPPNLAGLPALSMPAGLVNQLPVGMQLIGPRFSESLLLNATHQFQQATDWHDKVIPPL